MENEQKKNKADEKPIVKSIPEKEEIFVGRSLYDSFNYFNHIVSRTSGEEYHNLCKTIEFGMQLLPNVNKIEDQTLIMRICGKENLEVERKAIIELYNDACDVLKEEVPQKSYQKYAHGNPSLHLLPQVSLDAEDAEMTECPPALYEKSEEHFTESQFASHLSALRTIKNRIFHMLAKYEIIPKTKESFKEVMERVRVENYKKRHGVK